MAEEKNRKKPKRYATHEEFEAAIRRHGIPVRNTTATRPEERKQELFFFQGPSRSFREPDEGEEGGEEVEE